MNGLADASPGNLFGADLAIVVGGAVFIGALYVWMLRRERPMLSVEREGLQIGKRLVPWAQVESMTYARGGQGAVLRLQTAHGQLAFAEDQLIQHPDDVRRRIAAGAGLVSAPVEQAPKGSQLLPGDLYEEWRRPLPRDFEQAAAGTAGPRHATAEAESRKASVKKAAVGLAALLALLAKLWKGSAVAFKWIFGSAKLGGLLPTALSMLASVWVYAQLGGWFFAAGFVLLLFLHELGHATVIRAKGLRTSPIVFIPLFGALISVKDQFRDASVEAEMAWGGPAIGTLAASGAFVTHLATGHPFWLHLAYVGFLINLFNLLPVSPLDGGRIVAAISTWLWVVGLLLAGALALKTGHPILILVVVLGAMRAYGAWKRRHDGDVSAYYDLPGGYRALIGLAYFGLCGFLGWMTWHTHALAQAGLAA